MLEYIFSHKSLADAFSARLRELTIPHESQDDVLGFVIALPDELGNDLIERVEEHYAELLVQSEVLFTNESEANSKHTAGITLTLNDGRTVEAMVRPELLNRMLDVISFDELNEFVAAIADAITDPDQRPVCQR